MKNRTKNLLSHREKAPSEPWKNTDDKESCKEKNSHPRNNYAPVRKLTAAFFPTFKGNTPTHPRKIWHWSLEQPLVVLFKQIKKERRKGRLQNLWQSSLTGNCRLGFLHICKQMLKIWNHFSLDNRAALQSLKPAAYPYPWWTITARMLPA